MYTLLVKAGYILNRKQSKAAHLIFPLPAQIKSITYSPQTAHLASPAVVLNHQKHERTASLLMHTDGGWGISMDGDLHLESNLGGKMC